MKKRFNIVNKQNGQSIGRIESTVEEFEDHLWACLKNFTENIPCDDVGIYNLIVYAICPEHGQFYFCECELVKTSREEIERKRDNFTDDPKYRFPDEDKS